MKNSKIYIDWRYNLGLNQFNKPEKRYSNEVLYNDFQHVESDFVVNHHVITIGLITVSRR